MNLTLSTLVFLVSPGNDSTASFTDDKAVLIVYACPDTSSPILQTNLDGHYAWFRKYGFKSNKTNPIHNPINKYQREIVRNTLDCIFNKEKWRRVVPKHICSYGIEPSVATFCFNAKVIETFQSRVGIIIPRLQLIVLLHVNIVL